jgi:CheY-like chemotaxis protein
MMAEHRILLVEDEQIASMDLREMIEDAGYTVAATKPDADAALEYLAEDSVDLVLMDINLPGDRDGIDATREINERFDVPVVYLTAFSDEDTLERARSTEPSGFLVKPVTQADIRATLEMIKGSR